MPFIPELCSDYPAGYQTILALDGNDALVSAQLRAMHDEETGEHIDPAIPTGLVRVGTSFQRSVSWAHGCLGFVATERVGVTAPQLLASTNFSDATDPRFVFLSTETDTTGEFAFDSTFLACASRAELTALENPMVAFFGARPLNGVSFGTEWPPQPLVPDLNSIRDGLTFSRIRGVELTDGLITSLTSLGGAGAARVVGVDDDGLLSAVLVGDALMDGDLVARVTVLESDVLPLNGNFEFYDGAAFRNWSGTFDATGVDPGSGRYIELGTTARQVDSSEFAIPGDVTMLEVLARRHSGSGNSGTVRLRWYTSAHSFISADALHIVSSTANVWFTTLGNVSPPATAAYAVVRLENEATVTLQYGSVRIRPLSRLIPATLTGVTLDSDFVAFDADSTPRVMLEASGRLSLTGGVKRSSGNVVNGETLMTTPSGFRPATRNRFFTAQCFGGMINVTWQTSGNVVVNFPAGYTATTPTGYSPHLGIWFDGISFDPRA